MGSIALGTTTVVTIAATMPAWAPHDHHVDDRAGALCANGRVLTRIVPTRSSARPGETRGRPVMGAADQAVGGGVAALGEAAAEAGASAGRAASERESGRESDPVRESARE